MTRADFHNPISQWIIKLTHPLLKPFRKIIPSLFRQDTSCLVFAYLVQLAVLLVVFTIANKPLTLMLTKLPILALVYLLNNIIYLFYLLLIGSAILSWIAPDSRSYASILIRQITNFILAPLRRVIPPLGIFDITPMVALIIMLLLSGIIEKILGPLLLMGFNNGI